MKNNVNALINRSMEFQLRFGFKPTTSEERNNAIQKGNVEDFIVASSCAVPEQLGLFANRSFNKGELLGKKFFLTVKRRKNLRFF
jgi:hypothetical protein